MITMSELTMGREKVAPEEYTKEVQANLKVLHEKINIVRSKYGKPMKVNSGWRTKAVNDATSNAAKKSKHLSGLAVDIADIDGLFWKWCINNLQLLQDLGLYLEDKRYTKTWTHLQIGPPMSGKRIFKPIAKNPLYPELWDGNYDLKFDKA